MERVQVTDYFIGADQTIPIWLIKIAYLGKVKTESRFGIKNRFDIMGFNRSGHHVEFVAFPL